MGSHSHTLLGRNSKLGHVSKSVGIIPTCKEILICIDMQVQEVAGGEAVALTPVCAPEEGQRAEVNPHPQHPTFGIQLAGLWLRCLVVTSLGRHSVNQAVRSA